MRLLHAAWPTLKERKGSVVNIAGVGWTIPKGEIEQAGDPLSTAQREFEEETGLKATGPFYPLGSVVQKFGKIVHAWAFRGDCDPSAIRSNLVEIEWPSRSITIPEIDRASFFNLSKASQKLNPAQVPLLTRLEATYAR